MQIKKTRRCLVSAMCHRSPQQRGWNQHSTINQSRFDLNSRYFLPPESSQTPLFQAAVPPAGGQMALWCIRRQQLRAAGVKKGLLQPLLLAANIPAGAEK